MSSKWAVLITGLILAPVALAQQAAGERSLSINFPKDSPLTLLAADWGESRASAQGGAMVIDLNTSLSLKNISSNRVRGVTLLVLAQDVTPGGKASVAVPSLDVAPGESFPIHINLRLLRPLQSGAGPLVEIGLDGVLFGDLSFYGPNKLNSRRSMTVWELEARRDRRHFKSILEAKGPDALQRSVLASLARQAAQPRLDVQMAHGRATNVEAGHEIQFAFVQFPGAPVETLYGAARVAGNQARIPAIEVRNRSDRAICYLEVAMLVSDRQGTQFVAGSMPADLRLAPGQESRIEPQNALRFSRPGKPFAIGGMMGFVNQVEFSDGSVWIPNRAELSDPRLAGVVTCSAEEQRLTEIYRRRGRDALIRELNKF